MELMALNKSLTGHQKAPSLWGSNRLSIIAT
ncbi:hypothetical protein swp_0903 [Shewanella piezotolerans WP3]|uniref:Uncharacterized protein n=1 Tax=Shewanella piezotolerans (strain WP3 / JCM 13877) TaxID=225849 RepID=B8CK06_SHEPW|nr:hypothetical protein swp_0903 [Shewanella piezotolerans WP3]